MLFRSDNVKAYLMANVYTGLRAEDGAWELQLFAKNLFDTQRVLSQTPTAAITSIQSYLGASTFTSNYSAATLTPPREIGLNLRVAFGSR